MVVYHNLAGNARILFEYAKFIFVGFDKKISSCPQGTASRRILGQNCF
jgi:hypothetical protein